MIVVSAWPSDPLPRTCDRIQSFTVGAGLGLGSYNNRYVMNSLFDGQKFTDSASTARLNTIHFRTQLKALRSAPVWPVSISLMAPRSYTRRRAIASSLQGFYGRTRVRRFWTARACKDKATAWRSMAPLVVSEIKVIAHYGELLDQTSILQTGLPVMLLVQSPLQPRRCNKILRLGV